MEQHVTFRRVAGMLVGIVIISLGVALFKFAHLGNDPFNALTIRSAELAGLTLGVQNLIYNAVFFTMQMIWGRRYVGFGTVANAVCCGFIITFFYDFLTAHFAQAATLPAQLPWVAAAVVCTSLGISLHQTSDLGVAPYDYLALGLRDHTPLPYFCCRLFTDTLCALLAFLLGGLLGLGTLICAFCLGPLIQFFTPMFPKTCCNMFQPGSRHNIYQRRNHNFAAAAALACRCFWLFNGILSKYGVRYKKT